MSVPSNGSQPGSQPGVKPPTAPGSPAAAAPGTVAPTEAPARLSVTPQDLISRLARFVPPLFLVVLFLMGLFGDQGLIQLKTLGAERQRVEASIRAQEKLNRQYQHQVRRLQSDNHYLERLAREEMGMVRPGELVYQFKE